MAKCASSCTERRLRVLSSSIQGYPAAAALPPSVKPASTWEEILAKYPNDVTVTPHPGWKGGFLYVNEVRLHYWRTPGGSRPDGTPKPVIVLSHGMGDNGLSWWYFLGELTDQFELVSIEARGHGLSDPPTDETPPDAQAEDIAAVIDELGLIKPIVMGHSMGSASTMWFAARHPDVPAAVVLEDPQLRMSSAEPQPQATTANRAPGGPFAFETIFAKNNMTFRELLEDARKNLPGSWGAEKPGELEMVERWAQGGHQMVAKHQHHPNSSNWGRASARFGGRPAAGELFE
jgi:pimeloyl-ACP methyl ester carboxylesterase